MHRFTLKVKNNRLSGEFCRILKIDDWKIIHQLKEEAGAQ